MTGHTLIPVYKDPPETLSLLVQDVDVAYIMYRLVLVNVGCHCRWLRITISTSDVGELYEIIISAIIDRTL